MVVASFGDGQNLVREYKVLIKDEANVASIEWALLSEESCILSRCFLSPMNKKN